MTKPRVLVTTGNGRTGRAAIAELLRLGFPVRAFVSREDARARRLRDSGAEVFVGDLYDWRDLQAALRGVGRAYHCPAFDARHLHGSSLFALAAEEAKLEVVALMSGWNPHPAHPSVVQREHWITNNLYRRLSVDVVHVNPGMFAFTYLMGLPMLVHFGMLALPFGEGLNAPPSNEDIGALAAGVLADPSPYIGRCLRPTGPRLLSPTDIAGITAQALGRKVSYRAVSTEMFVKAARAQGFPTFQIAQVRHYASEMREGVYADVTQDVEEVCKRPAETFDVTARRYLRSPELIVPGLQAGSFASALGLALRMVFTRALDLDAWERAQSYPLIRGALLAHENDQWMRAASQRQLLLQPDRV